MALANYVIRCGVVSSPIGQNYAPLMKEIRWSETSSSAAVYTTQKATEKEKDILLIRISTSIALWVTWGASPEDPSVATSKRDYININANEGQVPYDIYVNPGDSVKVYPA